MLRYFVSRTQYFGARKAQGVEGVSSSKHMEVKHQ